MSVAQKIVELTAQIEQLMAAANARDEVHKAELAEATKNFITANLKISELTSAKSELESQLAKSADAAAKVAGELELAKKKLALEPFTHVTDGVAPVADGASVDSAAKSNQAIKAEWESLEGAEKTLFYRKNKAAIDAAFNEQK